MKEKLKVYHGLPKTPITDSTLYYSSFDGKTKSEVGTTDFTNSLDFYPMPTGYGLKIKTHEYLKINFEATTNITIDFWIDFDKWSYTENPSNTNLYEAVLMGISKLADQITIRKYKSNQKIAFAYSGVEINLTNNSVAITGGIHHCRFVVLPNLVRFYLNGVVMKEITSARDYSLCDSIQLFFTENTSNRSYVTKVPISDFHISKGDLGDYFPTLPQDFIDGKAIVVPALNQRQSYGDPVLHQVTELLVPYATSENNPYSNVPVDELYTHKTKPELSVNGADLWGTNSKIRIKGLNNSVITGVFDTDTAKCRIIEEVRNTTEVPVNSVSGISVGDTLVYVYSSDFRVFRLTYTVQAVDSVNNIITLDSNSTWYAGDYFFETTASSSSPVVKTVDGDIVNGTWSGLGTSVATFTLGSNSNIAGKDLIVTYCLNAVGNSSPYPKMPSEVIRGYNELGHELIPANGIVIQDDFKGKISGSILECPHTLKYALESSLRLPNDHWNEFTQSHYNTVASIASPVQGHIAQILVEVDLVRFVENKMGVEIPGNKLNWLNNNIKNITCKALVRGNNDTNNNCYIKYMGKGNSWILNSSGATSNSSSGKLIIASWSPTGLLSSTKSYFLIHSDALSVAGNDNLKSRVVLSDVQLELTFNIDERYDYLYTKDLASRCDGYANPILVDKQTKEVKRLMPSTAPFSTEVLTYNSGNITSLSNCTLITQSNTHMLTTMGTGSSDPFVENQYRGLLGKLDLAYFNSADYLGEPAYRLPLGANTSRFSLGCKFVLSQAYMENMNFFQISEVFPNVNQLAIKHGIVKKDTELYLRLLVLGIKANSLDYTSSIQYYKLPNRPLIK